MEITWKMYRRATFHALEHLQGHVTSNAIASVYV